MDPQARPAARTPRPLCRRSAVGWCAGVLATASVTLALCNAEAARGWADGLAPSQASQALRGVCDGWADLTAGVGLSTPRRLVRGAWERRHALHWPGAAPVQDQR